MSSALYSDHVLAYRLGGWSGVLPLPPQRKFSPPAGWTGREGRNPDDSQIEQWMSQVPDGNIALRLPPDVVGIDVDAYGNKPGRETLAALEENLGPLPPTWISTSREDGVSGIRLFRCQSDIEFPGGGPGIDIIQHHHRYTVVAPSVHPEGRIYHWITPDGQRATAFPSVDDLPELPAAW